MNEQERRALTVAEFGGVRIRHKHLDDALDDFHWRRNPEITRFDASAGLTRTYSDFLDHFERELRFPDGARRGFSVEAAPGDHIGNVMFYNGETTTGSVEVGISIADERFRGAGIGTAVMVNFVRFIWETTPYRRIYLHTLAWNERAQRCFLRVGFQQTARVFRETGEFLRMETKREWWLLWDMEGRFSECDRVDPAQIETIQASAGHQEDNSHLTVTA